MAVAGAVAVAVGAAVAATRPPSRAAGAVRLHRRRLQQAIAHLGVMFHIADQEL